MHSDYKIYATNKGKDKYLHPIESIRYIYLYPTLDTCCWHTSSYSYFRTYCGPNGRLILKSKNLLFTFHANHQLTQAHTESTGILKIFDKMLNTCNRSIITHTEY